MKIEPRVEQTLLQVLQKRATRSGEKPWLLAGDHSVTYREMDQLSNRLARGMTALGIGSGEPVLLMMPDRLEFIALWCAFAKLGAIEVPVNTHLRGTVLAHVINDSLARTMIVDRQLLDRIEDIVDDLSGLERLVLYSSDGDEERGGLPETLAGRFEELCYETLVSDDPRPLSNAPRYNDLMAVMYTSGTTGPSKGVMITHAHAYEYALSVVETLELRESDVYYAPLPLFHIAGQWGLVYACCIMGATAVLPAPFSASRFWEDVSRYRATCTFLLGAMANLLYRQPQTQHDADNTLQRALIVPLLPETEEFKNRFDLLVSTSWGSTEVNVPVRSGFNLPDSRTCGRLVSDRYEVRIVDEDDNELPDGVPGEAAVRPREPWIVMAGYWNHPEWTAAAAWRNLWLHSGDMLRRDEAGNFYFVDRVKDAIRRRGENI